MTILFDEQEKEFKTIANWQIENTNEGLYIVSQCMYIIGSLFQDLSKNLEKVSNDFSMIKHDMEKK